MKEWSPNAKEQMKFLGNFGPTVDPKEMFIKGCMLDDEGIRGCKTYLGLQDLRNLGSACLEVADWLESRAHEAQQG